VKFASIGNLSLRPQKEGNGEDYGDNFYQWSSTMLLFLDRVFKSVPSEGWKGATVYPRCLSLPPEVKGATSRILHLEKAGKFFQVCHS